jgi:RimJ/RimL family protein N-acetyltransferase
MEKSDFIDSNKNRKQVEIDLLYANNLKDLNYTNSDIVTDWINILDIEKYESTCLAAIVKIDNIIASCSAIDCIINSKIEIGILTTKEFRKKGHGKSAVESLIRASFLNRIEEIGWHCPITNKGSRKIAESLGFKLISTYEAYTPYPPIENISDLSTEEWIKYANFYMEKAKDNPDHYWLATICWANSKNIEKVIDCIHLMLGHNIHWFIELIDESEEFKIFEGNDDWNQIKEMLKTKLATK